MHEGYVSRTMADYGKYTVTQDKGDALIVGFEHEAAVKGGAVNLYNMNSEHRDKYPALNCVVGTGSSSKWLGPGHGNFCTLGGGHATAVGVAAYSSNSFSDVSKIPRASESSIFKIDVKTGKIELSWVDVDCVEELQVGLTQYGLIAAGDKAKFTQTFGSPQKWLKFAFEKAD
jgi:hypothetical protein